jgi:hypothetical protein
MNCFASFRANMRSRLCLLYQGGVSAVFSEQPQRAVSDGFARQNGQKAERRSPPAPLGGASGDAKPRRKQFVRPTFVGPTQCSLAPKFLAKQTTTNRSAHSKQARAEKQQAGWLGSWYDADVD